MYSSDEIKLKLKLMFAATDLCAKQPNPQNTQSARRTVKNNDCACVLTCKRLALAKFLR